mmetsp:Transcript_18933/g.43136  ORF Transcript_18933/g.43136 Transcript_18933/m.43136 type:complete len:159 (-) Transcript_18933:21-497(-)
MPAGPQPIRHTVRGRPRTASFLDFFDGVIRRDLNIVIAKSGNSAGGRKFGGPAWLRSGLRWDFFNGTGEQLATAASDGDEENLFRLVSTCFDLFRLVSTCSYLFRLVRLVPTCSDAYDFNAKPSCDGGQRVGISFLFPISRGDVRLSGASWHIFVPRP